MGIVIGFDAHLRACVYKVKDDFGRLVGSETIPATKEALGDLAKRFQGATVVIEASSVHLWMCDVLAEAGMDVFACHPVNIRRVTGKKNDESDAGFLADAYRLGALPRSYVPPRDVRHLRQLARYRAFLGCERTRVKNRVHGILQRKGVKLVDPATSEETTDVFLKRMRSRISEVDDFEIQPLLELVDVLHKKVYVSERFLQAEANRDPRILLLATVPGFGTFTAASLMAEIGDVTRFPNADALASYFGIVPSESQSRETTIRGHITRRGSGLVRGLLNQAAWNHVRTCPESSFTKQYKRLSKRIGKKRAIVAVERKLVKCAFWMLKENRGFKMNG